MLMDSYDVFNKLNYFPIILIIISIKTKLKKETLI